MPYVPTGTAHSYRQVLPDMFCTGYTTTKVRKIIGKHVPL